MREGPLPVAGLASALLLAHCAWITPGVGVEVSVAADDAPGPLLDARGTARSLSRATLRVESLALLACPDASPLAAPLVGFGPSHARAHDERIASLGPLLVDLLETAPRVLDRLEPVPGEYCDVRVTVAPSEQEPTLRLEGDGIAVASWAVRERVVRVERVSLTEQAREASVRISISLAGALDRVDPTAPDEIADGASALGAVLRSLRVE